MPISEPDRPAVTADVEFERRARYRARVATDPFHEHLLEIVLRLPGAYEDRPWGSVHCKVAGKIFVGWGRHEDGEMGMGFRVDKELQSTLVASDPRFTIAKYVGQHGGVDMRLGPKPNWDEVEQFIVESYRIIAPKKLVKELDARAGASGAAKPTAPGKAAPKKTAVSKKTAAKA
jgi:predicted DNA-binding protein (MmcQ/YjbR family)